MKKKTSILIILLFAFAGLLKLKASNSEDVLKAYKNRDMGLWETVIDRMEKQQSKDGQTRLELLNYYYGYIGYTLAERRKSEARSLIKMAYIQLEALERQNFKSADLEAYRAALYSYGITLNTFRAPFLGPKCLHAAQKALELEQNNPMALTQFGNIKRYMPAMFGGSKQEGMEYYLKALLYYEKDPARAKTDWNYLNLLITITMTHLELEQEKEARECYEKIIQIAPEMHWAIEAFNPQNSKKIYYKE